jgi:hypothetical protein
MIVVNISIDEGFLVIPFPRPSTQSILMEIAE